MDNNVESRIYCDNFNSQELEEMNCTLLDKQILKAYFHLLRNDIEQAKYLLNEIQDNNLEENVYFISCKVALYRIEEEYGKGLEEIRKADEINVAQNPILLNEFLKLQKLINPKEYVLLLDNVIFHFPNFLPALIYKSLTIDPGEKPQEVLFLFKDYISGKKSCCMVAACNIIGEAYFTKSDSKEAIKWFNKANRLKENQTSLLWLAVVNDLDFNNYEQTLNLYIRAMELDNKNMDVYFSLFGFLLEKNKVKVLDEKIKYSLEANKDSRDFAILATSIYTKMDALDEALKTLKLNSHLFTEAEIDNLELFFFEYNKSNKLSNVDISILDPNEVFIIHEILNEDY